MFCFQHPSVIRKRGLGEKDNDSVFAVEMTSAIRIANWVVIKILINYLLLFHREEISAYLIGVAEIYSVPCLHKLNVKNESESMRGRERDGAKVSVWYWARSSGDANQGCSGEIPGWWGSDPGCWKRCFDLGVYWRSVLFEKKRSGWRITAAFLPVLSNLTLSKPVTAVSNPIFSLWYHSTIPPHTIRDSLSHDFCLLIYFNFSSAHAPGTYTIMAITHCTKHINNFSMKEKEKAEIRVL